MQNKIHNSYTYIYVKLKKVFQQLVFYSEDYQSECIFDDKSLSQPLINHNSEGKTDRAIRSRSRHLFIQNTTADLDLLILQYKCGLMRKLHSMKMRIPHLGRAVTVVFLY